MQNKTLIIIQGPTGVGKTDQSIEIAKHFNTDILSCDSRQFYQELRIGTAVPDFEQMIAVRHHFIQHLSINDYYNVSNFENDVLNVLEILFKDKDQVIMVGGSGMYIDAVCFGIDDIPDIDPELRDSLIERMDNEGIESLRFELKKLDPEAYEFVDLKNKARVLRAVEVCMQTGKPYSSFKTEQKKERDFNIIKIGLNRDREELYDRINKRVDIMMEQGLEEEARLVYPRKGLVPLKTVGYRELFDFFDGNISKEKAVELIKRNSRRYAKRQLTWFRRYEDIEWFHPDNVPEIISYLESSCKETGSE